MRTRTTTSHCFPILLLGMLSALACHSDPPSSEAAGPTATASASASAEAQASLVTPSIGGSVVAVGDRQVELAILENGQVLGLVYDAQGKALAAAELPQVSVALRTQGGGRPSAQLAWNVTHACLAGRAQLEAGLVAEPIDVSLELNGKLTKATLDGYAILPFARFGGNVLAVGPYAVELVAQSDAVLAYVLEASGKARAGAELELGLQLGGGKTLALAWDAGRARYSAALDAKLDLAAQPLRLSLTALGKSYLGAAASLQALAKARVDARGQLGVAAALDVPAPKLDATLAAAARVKAQASAKLAAPSVKVAAPNVTAKLAAPKLDVQKSVSASAGSAAKGTKAKAGAGVKASASFSLGK